jgi:class 3 adenylate cyclase
LDLTATPRRAPGVALAAAAAIWDSLDRLGEEFGHDLNVPLRFGIGIHAGLSIVPVGAGADYSGPYFLGDTGNVASRLEALSKEFACTAVVSEDVFSAAGIELPETAQATDIMARGREKAPVRVLAITTRDGLASLTGAAIAPRLDAYSRCGLVSALISFHD